MQTPKQYFAEELERLRALAHPYESCDEAFSKAIAIFNFSDLDASKAERDEFLASQGLVSSEYPFIEVPSLNRTLLFMFNMNNNYNFKSESHTFIIATGFGPCSYKLSFTNDGEAMIVDELNREAILTDGDIAIINQYHSSLDGIKKLLKKMLVSILLDATPNEEKLFELGKLFNFYFSNQTLANKVRARVANSNINNLSDEIVTEYERFYPDLEILGFSNSVNFRRLRAAWKELLAQLSEINMGDAITIYDTNVSMLSARLANADDDFDNAQYTAAMLEAQSKFNRASYTEQATTNQELKQSIKELKQSINDLSDRFNDFNESINGRFDELTALIRGQNNNQA